MSLAIATYLTVTLLAFQQLNVVGRHYLMAVVTSFLIALAQYYMIRLAAHSLTPVDILVMGVGGSAGVVTAMITHDKLAVKWGKRT